MKKMKRRWKLQSYRQRTKSRDFLFWAGNSIHVGGAMRASSHAIAIMHHYNIQAECLSTSNSCQTRSKHKAVLYCREQSCSKHSVAERYCSFSVGQLLEQEVQYQSHPLQLHPGRDRCSFQRYKCPDMQL